MNPEDVQACINAGEPSNGTSRFSPPTKRYNIDFVFDGHDYKIVPASRAAARVFEYKSPNDATVQ
jgi:hypothetical protein